MPANTLTGMGLGALLAVAGEAASFDPMTFITGAGVCGAIAWVLLRSQMERAKRDADARDKSEGELVSLVRETVKSQAEQTEAINALTKESRETNFVTRELITTLRGRPCLAEQKKDQP